MTLTCLEPQGQSQIIYLSIHLILLTYIITYRYYDMTMVTPTQTMTSMSKGQGRYVSFLLFSTLLTNIYVQTSYGHHHHQVGTQ